MQRYGFVWTNHRFGVQAALDDCGMQLQCAMQVVHTAESLRGYRGGTFFVLRTHSPLPQDISEIIPVLGMTVITVDDSYTRDQARERAIAAVDQMNRPAEQSL